MLPAGCPADALPPVAVPAGGAAWAGCCAACDGRLLTAARRAAWAGAADLATRFAACLPGFLKPGNEKLGTASASRGARCLDASLAAIAIGAA